MTSAVASTPSVECGVRGQGGTGSRIQSLHLCGTAPTRKCPFPSRLFVGCPLQDPGVLERDLCPTSRTRGELRLRQNNNCQPGISCAVTLVESTQQVDACPVSSVDVFQRHSRRHLKFPISDPSPSTEEDMSPILEDIGRLGPHFQAEACPNFAPRDPGSNMSRSLATISWPSLCDHPPPCLSCLCPSARCPASSSYQPAWFRLASCLFYLETLSQKGNRDIILSSDGLLTT
jgi:hypothetical protein